MTIRQNILGKLALSVCLLAAATSAFGQTTPKEGKQPSHAKPDKPLPKVYPPMPRPPGYPAVEGVTSEKSIDVDQNANVKLCVFEGRLKINGWDRSELRVFVKDGSRMNIRVLEKDDSSGKAAWVWIVSSGGAGVTPGQSPECISGETIEIDAPKKATFTITGRSTQTTVDSVKKVYVKNVEGSIALRNIPGGISATTYQGDVAVENSGGAISVESANGNIMAYEVNPGQIGDLFKAKTNSGAISLQRVEHRQIEANSITGSVVFNGKLLTGGLYNFKTSNGSIRLLIPENSSCTIKASYGFGVFNSEIPLKFLYHNNTLRAKDLAATLGSGDATVNLITSSGSIGIRKQ